MLPTDRTQAYKQAVRSKVCPTQPMWLYRHVFAGSSMQLDISKVGAKPAKLQIA